MPDPMRTDSPQCVSGRPSSPTAPCSPPPRRPPTREWMRGGWWRSWPPTFAQRAANCGTKRKRSSPPRVCRPRLMPRRGARWMGGGWLCVMANTTASRACGPRKTARLCGSPPSQESVMDKPVPEAVMWPLSILEAGNWREVYMGTKHMRLEVSYPYEVWERLMAALAAAQQQPAGDAEAKTVPVPTRVHLIGETAVIVGTPERGWDEDAQDAPNCDAMGCATIGPHVLARVPFTDERAMSQPAEAQAQGGGEVVQRLRGVLEHGKMGDKCLIAPDLVTAAIAALSAPQPPAEAQERPEKPAECADGCPPQQVCDHCQWPPGPDAEAQAQGGG